MENLKPSSAQPRVRAKLKSVQSEAQTNGELSSVQEGAATVQIQSNYARAQFQLQLGALTKFQLQAQLYQPLSLNHNQGNPQLQKVCNFNNLNAIAVCSILSWLMIVQVNVSLHVQDKRKLRWCNIYETLR